MAVKMKKQEKVVEVQATVTEIESPPAPVIQEVEPAVKVGPEPVKAEQAPEPKPEPAAETPTAAMPAVAETIALFARSGESFAKGTENLLRAVERLNTITNRLESKVTIPDAFVTRGELKSAVEVAVEARVVDVQSAISSLKGELTLALNTLARAVCTACSVEWEDEPSSYFLGGAPATAVPASTNGDKGKTSDLEKALEELTI